MAEGDGSPAGNDLVLKEQMWIKQDLLPACNDQNLREESSVIVTSNASKLVQHGIFEALVSYTPNDKTSKCWNDLTEAVTKDMAEDLTTVLKPKN